MLALTSPALWYVVRGAGAVTLVLLTAALVLGIAVSMRWPASGSGRLVVDAMHRNVSLLAIGLLGVHVIVNVIDSFVSISLVDALVPFAGSYQRFWLGLGTLSLDLMLAVVITSLLRDRIGYLYWRLVHWTAYACWPLAVVHSIGMGTDNTEPWMLAIYGLTLAAVVGAIGWRINAADPEATPLGGARR